jgi:hypothetical protein
MIFIALLILFILYVIMPPPYARSKGVHRLFPLKRGLFEDKVGVSPSLLSSLPPSLLPFFPPSLDPSLP